MKKYNNKMPCFHVRSAYGHGKNVHSIISTQKSEMIKIHLIEVLWEKNKYIYDIGITKEVRNCFYLDLILFYEYNQTQSGWLGHIK